MQDLQEERSFRDTLVLWLLSLGLVTKKSDLIASLHRGTSGRKEHLICPGYDACGQNRRDLVGLCMRSNSFQLFNDLLYYATAIL